MDSSEHTAELESNSIRRALDLLKSDVDAESAGADLAILPHDPIESDGEMWNELRSMLFHPSVSVRVGAATALGGRYRDYNGLGVLIAADRLGRIRSERTRDVFHSTLDHWNQLEAVVAFRRLMDDPDFSGVTPEDIPGAWDIMVSGSLILLEARDELPRFATRRAIELVVRAGRAKFAAKRLAEMLTYPNRYQRAALDALAGIKIAAEGGLAEALGLRTSRRPLIRRKVIEVLFGSYYSHVRDERTRNPAVVEALIGFLRDEKEKIRTAAVEAVGWCLWPTPEVVTAAERALDDESEDVRSEAVTALFRFGPAAIQAEERLEKMLREDPFTRADRALKSIRGLW